jgi:hypothetical protein
MKGMAIFVGFNQPRTMLVFPFRAAVLYTNQIFPLKSSKSLACLNDSRSADNLGTRGAAAVMTDTMANLSLARSLHSLSRSSLNMTTKGEKIPTTDPGPKFGQG